MPKTIGMKIALGLVLSLTFLMPGLSSADIVHKKRQEALESRAAGRDSANTVANRLILGLSCNQLVGGDPHALDNYIWDLLRRIERGDFSYATFRDAFISEWKLRQEGVQGVGYLPKLRYEDSKANFQALEVMDRLSNPVLPVLDKIMTVAEAPAKFEDSHLDSMARRIFLIGDDIDQLEKWADKQDLVTANKSYTPISKELCERRAKSGQVVGWAYRSKLMDRYRELRKGQGDKEFRWRNKTTHELPIYNPGAEYRAISAHTMADRFLKGLWCEDLNYLYWEVLYRVANGDFNSKEFRDAVKQHLQDNNPNPWLTGLGESGRISSLDLRLDLGLNPRYFDSKDETPHDKTLLGILEDIDHDSAVIITRAFTGMATLGEQGRPHASFSNPVGSDGWKAGDREEKWKELFNRPAHYSGLEQRLLNWQDQHLIGENEKAPRSIKAQRRECYEEPSLKMGQEVNAHFRNTIDALVAKKQDEITEKRAAQFREIDQAQSRDIASIKQQTQTARAQLFSGEKKRVAELLPPQHAPAQVEDYAQLEKHALSAYEQMQKDDLKQRQSQHQQDVLDLNSQIEGVKAKKDQSLREAYRAKLEEIDRIHGEMIEWPVDKFKETYGMEGFRGACSTKAGNTWSNNRVMMMLYREFAREYSDYLITYNVEEAKTNPEVAAQKRKRKRDQLLKNFRLYFYMACAESDFDPIYVYPYESDTSKAKYLLKRYKDITMASIKGLKAHIASKKGVRSLVGPQGNAGVYMKSPDRFYTSNAELAYLDNFIGTRAGSTSYDIEQGVIVLTEDGKYDEAASIERIKNFCEVESTFASDKPDVVAKEIYDAITKSGPSDLYELDSLDNASTDKNDLKWQHFQAWAVLNGACPRFSYGMMRGTLQALLAKARISSSVDELSEARMQSVLKGYFAVLRRGVKSSCSDGNFSGYSLCYSRLQSLAGLVEEHIDKKADDFQFAGVNDEFERQLDQLGKRNAEVSSQFQRDVQQIPQVYSAKKTQMSGDIAQAKAKDESLVSSQATKVEQIKVQAGAQKSKAYGEREMPRGPSSYGVWPP